MLGNTEKMMLSKKAEKDCIGPKCGGVVGPGERKAVDLRTFQAERGRHSLRGN